MSESQVFLDGKVELRPGDCREVLKDIPDNSVDSVVTDPPYALVSIVKRFGKTDVDSTTDRHAKRTREGKEAYGRLSRGFMGCVWDNGETAFASEFWAEVLRVLKPGGHVASFSGTRTYHRMAVAIEDAGFEIRDQLAWVYGTGFPKSHNVGKAIDKAAGEPTDEARKWAGWGTALKPGWEPICLARKPLIGTVAENVLKYGTGALNVDGCRVGTTDTIREIHRNVSLGSSSGSIYNKAGKPGIYHQNDKGRWPANIVHDDSDEVVACFPNSDGAQGVVSGHEQSLTAGQNGIYGKFARTASAPPRNDTGSAARFFYGAKADRSDRIGSKHPTVKPVDLMRWLVRMVTPPGGLVFDPFAGSGTTGQAAWLEGMRCIMVEREEEYQADIAERMRLAEAGPIERKQRMVTQDDSALPLFGDNDNTRKAA